MSVPRFLREQPYMLAWMQIKTHRNVQKCDADLESAAENVCVFVHDVNETQYEHTLILFTADNLLHSYPV